MNKLLFLNAHRARWLKRAATYLRRFIGVDLRTLMAYWKKRDRPGDGATDADPDRDHYGLIWCTPALPFTSAHVLRGLTLIEETLARHGFDANLGINVSNERMVDVTVALLFDREIPGEDQRAQACHDDLLARLLAAGYPPYRLGVQSMGGLPQLADDSATVLKQIERILDPRGILAPGRYRHDS